jgi:hypothetical protein
MMHVELKDQEQTRMRPQGHDSPRAPFAALKLNGNVSFRASLSGLFRSAFAKQFANSC